MAPQICCACGTSYPDAVQPPSLCRICRDERQFVRPGGQVWTTAEELASGHVNAWKLLESGLFEIHTHPGFAIGQRALLLRTSEGNVLWDCISLLDDATEALVRALGGLRAIAISHPHITPACRIGRAGLTVRSISTPRIRSGSCVRIPRYPCGRAKR